MTEAWACAKLNLNLHLLPFRKDGFFPVCYVNCELDIWDTLFFEKQARVGVFCDDPEVPRGEDNLVYKAAKLLRNYAHTKEGVRVEIEKKIPIRAGLGGGSSDAAVALRVLVRMWDIKISQRELIGLARQIGTDVCYSLAGGLALVEADGTKIRRFWGGGPELLALVLVPEEKKPSTEWSFGQLNPSDLGRQIGKKSKLLAAIRVGNIDQLLTNLYNDFEMPLAENYPVINEMKIDLLEGGAKATILCGSGLAMVGFYTDKKVASLAVQRLRQKYQQAIVGRILW